MTHSAPQVLNKKLALKKLVDDFSLITKTIETRALVTKGTNYSSIEQLKLDFPNKFTDEILGQYNGAVMGETKNAKGTALEQYCTAVLELKTADPLIQFKEIEKIEDMNISFDTFNTVVFNLKDLTHEQICSLMKRIRSTNDTVSFLLVFANSLNQTETFQALCTLGNQEKFLPVQIFFEDTDPKVTDGVCTNLKFGIFCGAFVYSPPLFQYNGGSSAIADVVIKISPPNPKIGFVNDKSLALIPVHNEHSSVVYIAEKKTIELFEKKFSLTKSADEEKNNQTSTVTAGCSKKFNYDEEMAEIEESIDEP